MKNRKIDQRKTMQVVIDKGYHTLLKKAAAESSTSIKELLEGYLAEIFAVEEKK